MDNRLFLLAGLLTPVAFACTQPPPPGAEVVQQQAKVLTRGTEFNCTPGQEWWRAAGTPKRGGTFTFGANANKFDHLDPTAGGSVSGVSWLGSAEAGRPSTGSMERTASLRAAPESGRP